MVLRPTLPTTGEVGVDLFGKIDESVDRCADDRPFLHVGGAGGHGPVLRLTQDGVDGGVARHLVSLVLEQVRCPGVLGGWEVGGRDDDLRIGPGGEVARAVDCAKRGIEPSVPTTTVL